MAARVKRALLIGINKYAMPGSDLRGCVNDALTMAKLLTENFGFDTENIRLLTDERATTQNIRTRLRWLVEGIEPGSTLFFHYSGHGSQVRDRSNDELEDGLDEILCPHDLDWEDPFTDDELGAVIKEVPKGVNFTIVLDCCHSGTGTRELFFREPLVHQSRNPRFLVPPPDIGFRMAAGVTLDPRTSERGVNMTGIRRNLKKRHFGMSIIDQNVTLLSGCRSNQTSADAWIENDYRGALSYSLFRTLRANRFSVSYEDLLRQAGDWLEANQFEQIPQLECPEPRRGWTFLGDAEHTGGVAPGATTITPATDQLAEIPSETRVVFVHGIGDHNTGYSNRWRAAFNRYLGLPLGNFIEVVWDDVFDRETDRALRKKDSPKLPALTADESKKMEALSVDMRSLFEARQDVIASQPGLGSRAINGLESADRAVDRGFFDWLINFDEYIGDFLKYLVSKRTRAAVDDRLKKKLVPLVQSSVPIVVISHSWGTVVGHNVLRSIGDVGNIAIHFTLGSPLWMSPVRSWLDFDRSRGASEQWINVDAVGDLIGGALHRYFDVNNDYRAPSVGGQPHSSYFSPDNTFVQRDVVAAAIREMDLTYLRYSAIASAGRRARRKPKEGEATAAQ